MKEAKRIQNIKEYYFSKKLKEVAGLRANGVDVLNLGIGNPDQPPPVEAINQLRLSALFSDSNGYQSYRGMPELREAISTWMKKRYDVNMNPDTEILPLMGSKEGIMHISQAFIDPEDEVLIPNPGYPTYKAVSSIVGAETLEYSIEPDVMIDLEALARQISPKTKIFWLNAPHMPTGETPNKEVLQQLIYLAQANDFIIVNDNPYSTILTDEYFSIFQLEGAKEVCLELNSLSKSHNMAGWRIGWVAGNSKLINSVLKVKSNMDSGMYLPLQTAAVRALNVYEEWINELNQEYAVRRSVVWEILDVLNCSYQKNTVGMFVWAKVPDDYSSSEDLSDYLLHEVGVFVAPGIVFGSNGKKYIRVSM
ncbi:MAG: aminotransferase class I/II-fold pyridoxal phosphate-dependent enzyme [Crocinitomicaceae bacterium]|nr:aminotransferase class I/II-fold pyridoxal phosphate-dependent enzyme [Crocinitomicaceae bacterium]